MSSGGGQGRVLGETEAEGLSRERKNKRVRWMGVFCFFIGGGVRGWGCGGHMKDERCNQGCVAYQECAVGEDSLKRGWEG